MGPAPRGVKHATWIDTWVVGDDSGQMVDRFKVDVIDPGTRRLSPTDKDHDVSAAWALFSFPQNLYTCHGLYYMVPD